MAQDVGEMQLSSSQSSMSPSHCSITVGKALREAREREGATLSEFAKRIKISSANLCDLESDRRFPRPRRIVEIALALGLDEKSFLELTLQQLLRREKLAYNVKILPGSTVD
jgi:transcriptional regulator with XRE-family HTH domain